MIQVNNGFKDFYYLQEDGIIYNSATKKRLKPDKNHTFTLKSTDNKFKKIALKTIYKTLYHKPYCMDQIVDLDNEHWKAITDTNQLYWVSDQGRIKSYQGYEAKILKPYKNKGGYARVDIIENGHRQSKLVHKIVAAAFLPLPDKLDMQIHHKDFNQDNQAANNLEWLTISDHWKKHNEWRKK